MNDENRIIQIMPAGGWRVYFPPDDPVEDSEPLVGWGLTELGRVVPLAIGNNPGAVEPFIGWGLTSAVIYHPDEGADRQADHAQLHEMAERYSETAERIASERKELLGRLSDR